MRRVQLGYGLATGGSNTIGSTLLIMAMDVAHACLTIRDVNHLADGIIQAAETLGIHQQGHSSAGQAPISILTLATSILEQDPTIANHPTVCFSTWRQRSQLSLVSPKHSPSAVAPELPPPSKPAAGVSQYQIIPEPITTSSTALAKSSSAHPAVDTTSAQAEGTEQHQQSVALVRMTLKLLYVTEFMVLMEYIEIIMPVIFSVYMTAMFYLPNRAYYPMLRNMSDDKIRQSVVNVLIYALLELLSLIGVSVVVWRKLRLSVLSQLEFVLAKQWVVVQWSIAFWVMYVVETTLEHLGFDYTFQFAWLKHHTP